MKEPELDMEEKMHKFGDCSFCGVGEVKGDLVELDYRYKGNLFVFQKVPAGTCQQCGEKYLTGKVSWEIERRISEREKWDKTIAVPLNIYSDAFAE